MNLRLDRRFMHTQTHKHTHTHKQTILPIYVRETNTYILK